MGYIICKYLLWFLFYFLMFPSLCKSFFLFLSFLPPCSQHIEFLGQGLNLSHSCDLHHSCSNTGSLTHCARLGMEPVSQSSRDATNFVVPQRELLCKNFLICTCLVSCIYLCMFVYSCVCVCMCCMYLCACRHLCVFLYVHICVGGRGSYRSEIPRA